MQPGLLFTLLVLPISFVLAAILTPFLRLVALRIGLTDSADGRRKMQKEPIPLAGGVSVILATMITITILYLTIPSIRDSFGNRFSFSNLFVAICCLGMVGLIDDYKGLRGRHKLIGQILSVSILIFSGHFQVQELDLLGWNIELGPFGNLFALLWLIGCINAINLMDGMDGMVGSLGTVICLTIAVTAALTEQWMIAVLATAVAASLLGFLCYNLPPASVYLGDCGSMVVGLVVGAISLAGGMKSPTAVSMLIPIALLALPIFDTLAAITRRKLTGRSIYETDRGHLHHCLLRTGMNRSRVLLVVVSLSALTSAGTIASIIWRNDIFSVIAGIIVIVTLIATRLFGFAEFTLIKQRLMAMVITFRHGHRPNRSHTLEVHLQGTADWNRVWEELTLIAQELNLRSVSLDVNAPAIHEIYHARWELFGTENDHPSQWRAELPLFLNEQVIGRLTAVGMRDSSPIWEKLSSLTEMLERAEEGASQITSRELPVSPAVIVVSESPLAGAV